MLLFISDYPDSASEKDGMMQRIAAIDGQFSQAERAYLKISFLKNTSASTSRRGPNLAVYQVNFFRHLFFVVRLCLVADCIYVHSVGNALAILPAYLLRKVITDMHGAVPEEFLLVGKKFAALRYSPVEWLAVHFSRAVVTVSNAMAEHLRNKYRLPGLRSLNVPIFDEVETPQAQREEALPTVIYAGGAQAWQNVDLMLETIAATKAKCRFKILTGDLVTFRRKLESLGLSDVEIGSVPKDEIYDHYASADYGFVLRDDTVVNRVACPTKLVEYLSCGVIPIVIQPRIGDFLEKGYSFLTLDNFLKGRLPDPDQLRIMKANNYNAIASMKIGALAEMQRLVELCTEGNERGGRDAA